MAQLVTRETFRASAAPETKYRVLGFRVFGFRIEG
jgi:hypothetical protein